MMWLSHWLLGLLFARQGKADFVMLGTSSVHSKSLSNTHWHIRTDELMLEMFKVRKSLLRELTMILNPRAECGFTV